MGRCEKNLPLTTGIAFSSFESGCAQGMATRDHTPHGRGYDTSFGYFHHANNCERASPPAQPKIHIHESRLS